MMRTLVALIFTVSMLSGTAYAGGPIEWAQKSSEVKAQQKQAEILERIAVAVESIAEALKK